MPGIGIEKMGKPPPRYRIDLHIPTFETKAYGARRRWYRLERACLTPPWASEPGLLQFAAQIDLTYVGGIERGKRNPSVLVLARIANALSTGPAALLRR